MPAFVPVVLQFCLGLVGVFLAWPILCVALMLISQAFLGFTFTDPEDFAAPALILLTPPLVLGWHLRGSRSPLAVRCAERAAVTLALVGPSALLAALYVYSYRAEQLIGHWPRDLIDDPKWIGKGDTLYRSLESVVNYTSAYCGWTFVAWLCLILHLQARVSKRRLFFHALLFISAWLAFQMEPGGRWAWFMD